MALVFVIALNGGVGAGYWSKIGSRVADRLDPGFLVIGDHRDLVATVPARGSGRAPHLDITVNAKHFGHFRLKLGIALLQVIAHPRLREGRLLCGFTSCAARILHTVP